MNDSSQVSVDPDALRALAAELSALSAKITETGNNLDRGLAVLGETFRNQQYQEFATAFRNDRVKLADFAEEVRRLVPKLKQDANDVDATQRARVED